ncbi:MAG TPA: hypothetical protein VGT07_16480 [Steroidobacteraceae bacterium]|nr:hypothetical protein [Steroidobacteraceae bacterium]
MAGPAAVAPDKPVHPESHDRGSVMPFEALVLLLIGPGASHATSDPDPCDRIHGGALTD